MRALLHMLTQTHIRELFQQLNSPLERDINIPFKKIHLLYKFQKIFSCDNKSQLYRIILQRGHNHGMIHPNLISGLNLTLKASKYITKYLIFHVK